MSGILNVYLQILELTFIVIIGIILKKKKIIGSNAEKFMTYFLLYISFPAITISSMMIPLSKQRIKGGIQIVLLSVVIYAFYLVLGFVLSKLFADKKSERGAYQYAVLFSNSGYLGVPILLAIYGKEALFYSTLYGIVYNILFYSIGFRMIKGKKDGKTHISEIINIGTMSTLVGILLCVFNVTLPPFVTTFLNDLGNTCTPFSMLIIGCMLCDVNFKKLFLNKKIYIFSVVRLAVIPLLTFLIIRFGFKITDKWLLVIPTVIAGMPVASSLAMVAKQYQNEEELAVRLVMVTTFLCCLTLPILMYLI